MANPGVGYRIAGDVLMEISFHLLQPACYQALATPVTAGTAVTAQVATTDSMYPGALLVVEQAANAAIEVITVTSVTDATHFVATFANNHAAGAPVWGATFPKQYQTDPIFTQSEMLGYLSRAQNEFLTAVPCNYQRFFQTVNTNQVYQSTPSTAVIIDRVAASPINIPIASMVRSGNVVTLTAVDATNLVQYNTLSVVGAADDSFDGVFAVSTAPSAKVITYPQVGADASTTGGYIQQMYRLYQNTQEELAMQERTWQTDPTGPLRNWFEDRAGLYKWGVGGRPNSSYPVELLCAVRDTDTLSMIDGFLVPDVCLHGTLYLALSYAASKDGVAQNLRLADFAQKRYGQVVMATQRYIQAMKMGVR